MRFTALVVAVFAVACIGTPAAHAGSAVGSFEIDGNLKDDSGAAVEPIDWGTPPPNLTTFSDPTGKSDDIFGKGSKELEPGGWSCVKSSAPGKDDLISGQISFRTLQTADGAKQFAYVNYRRKGVNGDAHIDYEFNQSSMANPACPATKARTPGDIVITFDTENGGSEIFVRAFEWTGFGFTQLPTGSKGVTFDGAVNIPNTIPGQTAGDFGEAALNLTDTIGAIACGEFSSAYLKTRASTSINAELKDKTQNRPIDVGSCPSSELEKAVRNVTKGGNFATTATAAPGDLIEYRLVYENNGESSATNVVVSDPIPDGATWVDCEPECTTDGPPVENVSWSLGTVPVGESRTVFFQVRLDPKFPAGSTAVTNVATATTREEGTKPSNPTTVTVSAAPASALTKAVRNATADGPFGTSTNAAPGDTIEYQLTYTNSGTADAHGVTISDPIPANSSYDSCSDDCSTDGPPVTRVTWELGTVEPNTTVSVTFRVKLADTFPAGATTPVENTGTVTTDEEGTKPSNKTTVNVLTPSSTLAKAVRNVTTEGAFATTATASPGDIVEYRLSYTNGGPGAARDVTITDPIPGRTTFDSCDPECKTDGPPVTEVKWELGTVAAGATRTVTFRVKLDPTFPSGSTAIENVGTVTTREEGGKPSNKTTVTVAAAPELALLKTADAAVALPGDRITYTLAYSNGGDAVAQSVRIDETIPAGTRFVECSDGCSTDGPPVTKAWWQVGDVAPGGSGSVTLTVEVLNSVGCQVCNLATISSISQGEGVAIPSNDGRQLCIAAIPGADPAGAHAAKSAFGASIVDRGLGIDQTFTPVSSSQSGVGSDSQSDELLALAVPPADGSLLRAELLRTTSTSTITAQPPRAEHTSTSEVLGVSVLGGLVKADVVRAVATTRASGTASSFDSTGSTIKGLTVQGVPVSNVVPGMRIDIPLLGRGSYVAIYERAGSTSSPPDGTLSGGTYAADLTVNMIRVHVDDRDPLMGGKQTLDVTVANAIAHSDFPQTRLCEESARQSVSGHAFVASAQTEPELLPVLAGYADIPATGGQDHQQLERVTLPADGSAVSAGAAESDSAGALQPAGSTASSYAQAADVCVLGCAIRATALRSQANSSATGTGRGSNPSGTTFAGLVVAGTPVALPVEPNTTIPLPGIGFVVLNEQVADGPDLGHTGLTVRAVHAVVTVPDNPLGLALDAEVIVAEAHSDATFIP